MGVGAVLSQRSSSNNKTNPCVFFPRRLSLAERNYNIGDRELFAMKLALEEWRHWLEGTQQPFFVWTDHKNLKYIRTGKRLNPGQARWSLFFNHFKFSLLISQVPRTQSLTDCLVSLSESLLPRHLLPSFPLPVFLVSSHGRWRVRCNQPWMGWRFLSIVLL